MKSVLVGSLTGLLLFGQALATFDVCSSTDKSAFTADLCCPSTIIKRASARHLLTRTDTCDDGSSACCTKKDNPVQVTSDTATTNLQCGRNYDGTSPDVAGGVVYSLDPCKDDTTQTCFHVRTTAASGATITDKHLQIDDAPITVNTGAGNWEFNSKCIIDTVHNVVDCYVPVSAVLAKFPDSPTTLCGRTIYVAAHIAIKGFNDDTCFAQGALIDTDGRGNWFMYSTVKFECPDVCLASCCCPPPPPPPPEYQWCQAGTAFGYKAGKAINFNGNPVGPALSAKTCNRWGWYYAISGSELSTSGLSGDLLLGAGGNDISKATDVGDFSATLSGSSLTVTYTMGDGFELGEVHVYASCSSPTTCAPGQYTFSTTLAGTTDTSFSKTLSVTPSCTKYYLIFHAAVNKKCLMSEPCPNPVV